MICFYCESTFRSYMKEEYINFSELQTIISLPSYKRMASCSTLSGFNQLLSPAGHVLRVKKNSIHFKDDAVCVHVCVQHVRRYQRTTCKSQFSPSNSYILVKKLRSSALVMRTFTHWIISPAQQKHFMNYLYFLPPKTENMKFMDSFASSLKIFWLN